MSSTHMVLHDPEGRLEAELPLDRELHKCLVKAVLGWTGNPGLPPADLQQIVLLLTGTARALADVVLEEADQRLSVPLEGTARCAQGHARLVRALYERLDRLAGIAPQTVTTP
ncbi:restriction endonuclease [Streptomyces sp. NPDC088178]|uniref:restriction endonuclease n=1 Tax=Streptomyces sp. NPDC088178 TaxID=3365836 RepID=UPI00380E8F1B